MPPGPAVPALPSAGGPAWVELTSQHFVLWTDAPAARGRELVRDLEDRRQVVLGVALHGAESKARILAIALRDADEVGAFVPPQFVAYAWGTPNPVRMPVIVLAADTPQRSVHIVTHELTHAITFPILPHQPHWFAEGLAGYFATAKISANRDRAEVGQPLDYIAARLRDGHHTPSAELFACAAFACMDDMFYASTWALVSYLANTHPAQLSHYMQRIAQLPEAQERQAWAESFPDETPDKLDHELGQWLAHGEHQVVHFAMTPHDGPVTERALADGDVLAARGLLKFMFEKDVDKVRPTLEAAIAADKSNVLAQLLVSAVTHGADADCARAATTAHPDDWRAWWLLGYAVQRGQEALDAHDKMCARIANDPTMDAPRELCALGAQPAGPAEPVKPMAM